MLYAKVSLDKDRVIGAIDRRVFGGFVEHMGRGVYGGIYDPGHPLADAEGFRTDVIDLVRELGVTMIRYPGGNFVSGFTWEDSVGPRSGRPTRLNLAWHSSETNEFGLHEFSSWLRKVDADLMLAVNLGTRGTSEAIELLEYANIPGGTALSDERRANGLLEPLNVRMWCLGNEMDGPWQLGQQSADDYGKLAATTAKGMRQLDPSLELVACGSSSSSMPTFGEWERSVLLHAYDDVDFLSCHAYYEIDGTDLASFLASAANMDDFIGAVIATADHVKAVRRSAKTMMISFDEWNVWYSSRIADALPRGVGDWPLAPPLSEDDYTVADGVVVGDLLMSLLRHADRVKSASLAQVVNVIAPIAAPEDGPAWRRSTFYPFALTSRHARGVSLDAHIESPTFATATMAQVPTIETAATFDENNGSLVVFLVNRDQSRPATVRVEARGVGHLDVAEAVTLSHTDPFAANTRASPNTVAPHINESARRVDEAVEIVLPPVSWSMVRLEAAPIASPNRHTAHAPQEPRE